MEWFLVYSSQTNNTKKIANTIGKKIKDLKIFHIDEFDISLLNNIDQVIIGGWIEFGKIDSKTRELITQINNKKVSYYFTSGFSEEKNVIEKVHNEIQQLLKMNNNTLVAQMNCQGKIDVSNEKLHEEKECQDSLTISSLTVKEWNQSKKCPSVDDLKKALNFASIILNEKSIIHWYFFYRLQNL